MSGFKGIRAMKILMFGWEFPPHLSGGLGTACLGITKGLKNIGAEVIFVLPKINEDFSSAPVRVIGPDYIVPEIEKKTISISEDQTLKQYKVDAALHPYMTEETYSEYLKHLKRIKSVNIDNGGIRIIEDESVYGTDLMAEVSRYALVGKHIYGKESFDIIHAHDWMTFFAAVEAKKESGKPLVVHIHATEFDRTSDHINSEIYCIEKYGMEEADKIIAVSKRTKETIVNKYNIDPEKIEVVYNAVEKEDLVAVNKIAEKSAYKDDKIVLFLGRITIQKGPEYFIEAAHKVLKIRDDVRFVMAGSGDMSKKMIEKMAKLKIIDRFHFTGFLDVPQRERLFAMSDLYVMPSVSEPFGITPLEAMKNNIPIIISKQSGISEILDDNVVKVDFWDVDKLSKAIIKVLSDKKTTKEMVKSNSKFLEKIDWDSSAKKIVSIYNNLV